MRKSSKRHRQTTDEPQAPTPESRYRVERYGSRNFAAYDQETLVAVTLYRIGAEEVTRRFTEKDRRIAELENRVIPVSLRDM
jgi:hypothetical protein